jgi:putative hydrolase of the HAD superfamily
MRDKPALFFDVGGVLLTNGWDTAARDQAIAHFGLDAHDVHTRHNMVKTAFETGRLTIEQYLQRTVFYKPRKFTPADFKAFMFEQSQELPGSLDFARSLAASGRYELYTLNNESREINEHRIERFRLAEIFECFFSSCYLGMEKPNEDIYATVLAITRCPADRGLFIDDRPINVEAAQTAGYRALHFQSVEQLKKALGERTFAV